MKFNAAEISRFVPFPLVSREIDKNKIKIEWKIQKRFSFLQAYPASSNGRTVHVGMSRQEEWRYAFRHPLSRHCHWRFRLPISINDDTHVRKRPPL